MTQFKFNAINYSHQLQKAGLSQPIADVEAEQLSNLLSQDVATKSDMQLLKTDIDSFIITTKKDLELLEHRMTIKLGSIMVVGITILGLISKFLH